MGYFDDIGKANRPSDGGVYLTEGSYPLLEIEALKVINSRQKRNFFVAEFKILKSEGEKVRPEGTRASWMVDLANDAAMGNIRDFVAKLYGVEFDEVDSDAVEELISKAQPAAGMYIAGEASQIKTKANKDFTKLRWDTIPNEEQPEAHRQKPEDESK